MHGTRIVQNKVTPQVGFFLVALGVELIGFRVQLPIDVFGAFAWIVDFMFGKLGRKPVKRTLVQTRDKAFDHLGRARQ